MHASGFLISATLALAGIGIPVMAALNAGLGTKLSNPIAAVFMLSLVAALCSFLLLAMNGHPAWRQVSGIPIHYFSGGFLFVFYLTAITYGAPRIGLGTAVLIVLFGQVTSAAVIDHLSLFGAEAQPLTLGRLSGMCLMLLGIVLARS